MLSKSTAVSPALLVGLSLIHRAIDGSSPLMETSREHGVSDFESGPTALWYIISLVSEILDVPELASQVEGCSEFVSEIQVLAESLFDQLKEKDIPSPLDLSSGGPHGR